MNSQGKKEGGAVLGNASETISERSSACVRDKGQGNKKKIMNQSLLIFH